MEPQSPLSRRWARQPGSGASRTGRGSLEGLGCGHVDEHAFALEGGLDGGADPGASVDVSLGTQAGEGVVDIWRDTDQQ